MSILEKIWPFAKKDKSVSALDLFSGSLGGITTSNIAINSVNALQNSVVAACVNIISEDVATVPLNVYRRQKNGSKSLAKTHFLRRLLKCPNNYQTPIEWLEMTVSHLALTGNSYSALIYDESGKCIEMHPIHPDAIGMWEALDGQYYYYVSSSTPDLKAMLRNLPPKIPSEFMLHIKWMSTQNSLYGTNRIQLAKEPVALSLSMEESAARLAGNGVRPSGVLSAPNVLNKESRERLTEALKQTHGGSHNHGGILLADGGLRWDSMRMSNVDAEFLATRMFQVAEIARYFRGPLHKLGIIEANQSGPSMIQSDQTYINEIVQRIHKTFDLDDTDYFVEFDYESFLKADITSRLNALRVGVLGSLFTINEARDRLGLQSVPDGDDILQPSNMVPLGTPPAQVGSGPGSDNTGAPAQDGDGDPSAAPRSEAD